MGTEVEIEIFDIFDEYDVTQIRLDIAICFQIFSSGEQRFSRFREDSELSVLNREKKGIVSDIFLEVFQKSKYFFEMTDGFFNPLIDISSLGYSQNFEDMQGERIQKTRDIALDFENIIQEGNILTIKNNHILDFGGIVKGYTVDAVTSYLQSKGYKNFLINAGGDIFMSGVIEAEKKCVVGIDNPFDNTELLAIYELENKATTTSGTYKRKWKHAGHEYHHIINPHTGKNTTDIISITLITDSVLEGDALATAGIAMGQKQALDFFTKQKIPALMVTQEQKIIRTSDWEVYNLEILFS